MEKKIGRFELVKPLDSHGVNEAIDKVLKKYGVSEEIDWDYGFERPCLQRTGMAWEKENRTFILARYDYQGDPDRSIVMLMHPSVDLDMKPNQYDVDLDICTLIRGEIKDYHSEYFPVLNAADWIKEVYIEFIKKMDEEDYFNRHEIA